MGRNETIYKEVMANFRSCHKKLESLSDTWVHTLAQKGEMYTIQEMMNMRSQGNRVNSWMVDSLFLVDQSIIDLNNPIIVRLLELGESDFGNPRKDTKVMGSLFSSLFLADVVHAARIIQLIEDAGLTHPRVMDIGGGSGLLLSLLKHYFQDRITLFFVDIPETLLIQEWHLRNCFPDVGHVYKFSEEHVNFKKGGLNFVNAYVLDSQDIEFDIVSNLASMQEMTEDTIQGYLTYIEKNISSNGVFYFNNRFGQSSGGVTEPSEYKLDSSWKIESARIGCPIDSCQNGYFLGCIFRRTKESRSIDARRTVLRTIWNGFFSGLIQDEQIIKELIGVTDSDQGPIDGITQVLKKHNLPVAEIPLLKDSCYFSQGTYLQKTLDDNCQSTGSMYRKYYFECINRNAQVEIIQLMINASTSQKAASNDSIKQQLDDVCKKFLKFESSPLRSEYWTARYAGILFTLGHASQAKNLINSCLEYTEHARWMLRFAILFSKYGFLKETASILEKLDKNMSDPFLLLKRIELENSCGRPQEVLLEELGEIVSLYGSDPVVRIEIAKTAAKIGSYKILQEACLHLKERDILAQRVGNPFFRISSLAVSNLSREQAFEFIQKSYEFIGTQDISPDVELEYGMLMLQMGDEAKGLPIIEKARKIFHDSYYRLGWAGSLVKKIGYDDLANNFLKRSWELRKNNFMHDEFIGGVYFSSGQYPQANQYFQQAAVSKPYLLGLRARAAFCGLPDGIRDSGIFGDASNLNMIFEEDQNFYNDSPNWK